MDKHTVKELRAAANQGVAALRGNRADQAVMHFSNALSLAEDLHEKRTRRDELAVLAALFDQSGFFDLGLSAAEDAVELDRSLGLESLAAQDLLEVGNAHTGLENTAKAEQCLREALAIFLRRKEYANAASANTNLAGIIANRGDMAQAVELFQTSLRYLAKESFENTEVQTRVGLLQALEYTKGNVETAIANARQLCSRFFDQMPEVQQNVVRDFVGQAAERYLASHRSIAAKQWKVTTFPMLYG